MAVNKDYLKKCPIDFIYVFTDDNFLSLVAKYISAKSANTIQAKRENQRKYLANLYNGYAKINYEEVSGLIEDQYGYTPEQILSKLLKGETVAGKNWKEGVYGVGKVRQDGFKQNDQLVVNKATGEISNRTGSTYTGIATYDNKGNILGYNYQIDGKCYTSIYDKSTGEYYANTFGDGDLMQYADGTTYTPSSASNIWEAVNTSISLLTKFIEWIASLIQGFKPISTKNTIPQQSELLTPATQSSPTLSSVGIVAAALFGGYLLLGNGSKKKRK